MCVCISLEETQDRQGWDRNKKNCENVKKCISKLKDEVSKWVSGKCYPCIWVYMWEYVSIYIHTVLYICSFSSLIYNQSFWANVGDLLIFSIDFLFSFLCFVCLYTSLDTFVLMSNVKRLNKQLCILNDIFWFNMFAD